MVWRLQLRFIRPLFSYRTSLSPSIQHSWLSTVSNEGDGHATTPSNHLQQSQTAAHRSLQADASRSRSDNRELHNGQEPKNVKTRQKPHERNFKRTSSPFQAYVPNPTVARIQQCQSFQDTLQTVSSDLATLSPRDTEAVWRHLLSLSRRNGIVISANTQRQLEAFFAHTTELLQTCHYADLSFIAYTLAQCIKLNDTQFDLLLHTSFWEAMQQRSIAAIQKLHPKSIVSIAWSFATISQPMYRMKFDVSPFFQAMLPVFYQKKRQFTSNNLANLSWSCMTCRVIHPSLFHVLSGEFVWRRKQEELGRRKPEALNPITLCQLANSCAKAGYIDEALFRCIANCARSIIGEFDSRNFANLSHSFATAGRNPEHNGTTLLDVIEDECVKKLDMATPQNMANLVWAYATLDYKPRVLFDAISREASSRLGEFQSQHLCNLAWGLSKYPPSTKVFDKIANKVVVRGLDSFTSQGLAILANSFATIGYKEVDFWDSIEKAAIEKSSNFGGIECSRIAWSFATVGIEAEELFRVLETIAIDKIGTFTTQGLSNIVWAFTVMNLPSSKRLFDVVSEKCIQKIEKFKPAETTMLMIAYSRLDYSYPELFGQVVEKSLPQLETFTLLDLYNIVVAYAKAGHVNERWMVAIADEVIRRSSLEHQTMHTGVLWAYATTRISHPKLVKFLSDAMLQNLNSLNGDNLASVAWSFATLGYHDDALFYALAETSDREKLNEFNSLSLANMAWSFATSRQHNPTLLNGIASAAIARKDFTPQGISSLLWAFATVGHVDDQLFSSMAILARESLDVFNSQVLANVAWAYTVADINAECLFGDDAYVKACIAKMEAFDEGGLSQLHQWNIWQRHIGSYPILPPAFALRCYNHMTNRDIYISRLQKDVVSELVSMGFVPEEEVQTSQSGYVLDAVVEVNGAKIGIEVDGPSHFLVHNEPDGRTMLKRRQVETIDKIPIVSIPYWEWNELEQSQERKQLYLKSKLQITS